MRILHVVPSYFPAWRYGGPIRAVHGLAAAQAALGHRVEVFTTDADGPGRLDVPTNRPVDRDGVPVYYFRVAAPRRLYRSPDMAWALAVRAGEFDLLHLHSVFLLPTSIAAQAAQRAGVPYLVAPRGMLVPDLLRARGRLRKWLWLHLFDRVALARAAALHVTSELEAAEAVRVGVPLPQAVVLPNGVDPAEIQTGADLPERLAVLRGRPYLLFLGRLSWKKGLDRLVEAVPLASPELHWVIAGNDDEGIGPGLRDQAEQLGVADRLHLVGEVRGGEKAALLGGSLALVLPSRSENFGNVVLESLAAGRPVVVSPGVGLAATVAAEGCGVVCAPEPVALAEAAGRLLADPEEASRMGAAGGALVAARFTWKSIARGSIEIYEEIVARATSRGPAQ